MNRWVIPGNLAIVALGQVGVSRAGHNLAKTLDFWIKRCHPLPLLRLISCALRFLRKPLGKLQTHVLMHDALRYYTFHIVSCEAR